MEEVCEARKVLNSLHSRFAGLHFEIKERDGVLYVNSFDRAFGFIDDTLVIVNDLQGEISTSLKDREDLLELRTKLQLLNDVLEKLGRCQSQVLYLSPLFKGTEEGFMLTEWHSLMETIKNSGSAVHILATEKYQETLRSLYHSFETLYLSLGYLTESEQSKFSRLYGCPGDEVLAIIASCRSRSFDSFQQFFRVLFSFHYVEVDGGFIKSLCTEDGEEVKLIREVQISNTLHEWGRQLEETMIESISQSIYDAQSSYDPNDLRLWVFEFPVQSILIAIQIVFTRRVESAIQLHTQYQGSGEKVDDELKMILQEVEFIILELMYWIRSGNRMKRITLLLSTVSRIKHGIGTLLQHKVREIFSLHWQRQIRWYINSNDSKDRLRMIMSVTSLYQKSGSCVMAGPPVPSVVPNEVPTQQYKIYVKQMFASYDHHGEYHGISNRTEMPSVYQDASSQVFSSLVAGYVGCLLSPVASKDIGSFTPSEFVSETAQSVGKRYRFISCDKNTSHATVARDLIGAFASGTWIVFDNIDFLDIAVLSVVTEGILSAQSALQGGSPNYQFEGKVIPIQSTTFAVFGILSNEYRNITENSTQSETDEHVVKHHGIQQLKRALLPVAMPACSLRDQLQLAFILNGIADYEMLSAYTASVFERVCCGKLQLPLSISVKQFLETLPEVRKVIPVDCEPVLAVINSFYKVILRVIPHAHYYHLLNILRACFGTAVADGIDIPGPEEQIPLKEDSRQLLEQNIQSKDLVPRPMFVKKCEQLYEAFICSNCVALIGPTATGKTTIWKSVVSTFLSPSVSRMIFLKLYDVKSLIGSTDSFNEWCDGPFTKFFRKLAESDPQEQESFSVVVFDGMPTEEMLNILLPVMSSNNRCLTLETGEVIRAPPGLRIVFESDEELPPRLKDICFVVRTCSEVLTISEYISTHANNPSCFLYPFRARVIRCLKKLVPALMQFCKENQRDWDKDKDPIADRSDLTFFPLNASNLIKSCFNIINGFKNKRRTARFSTEDSRGLAEKVVEPVLLFSCVWSFGIRSATNQKQKASFNQFLRNRIIDCGMKARFPMPMGNELGLVFDYVYDVEARQWIQWSALPEANETISMGPLLDVSQTFIPTIESVKLAWLLRHVSDKGTHVLLVGPPSTAKSKLISRNLRYQTTLHCTKTVPRDIERTLGARLQKSRDGVISLPDKLEKPLTLVLENLELADKSCLEFIRQLVDTNGWYDSYSNDLLAVYDVAFAATADVEGVLRFSERELQAFHFISVIEPPTSELAFIIKSYLETLMKNTNKRQAMLLMSAPLADSLEEIYLRVRSRFTSLKTSNRNDTDIQYNLSIINQVLQGVYIGTTESITHVEDMLRLFIHEVIFAFTTRLERGSSNAKWIIDTIWEIVLQGFPELDMSVILRGKNLLCFGGVDGYKEFRDPLKWREIIIQSSHRLEETLTEKIEIVGQQHLRSHMSTEIVENITVLLRCIRVYRGHVLALSDTINQNIDEVALAAFMNDSHLFRPRLQAQHTFSDWRQTLKQICVVAFISLKPCVVVLDEHNLPEECFSDISAIVKQGSIMGLFSNHDWHSITVVVCEVLRRRGESLKGKDHTKEIIRKALYSNMHFVIVRSPYTSEFGKIFSKYAALQTHFQITRLHSDSSAHLGMLCSKTVFSNPAHYSPLINVNPAVLGPELYLECRSHILEQQSTCCLSFNIDTTPTSMLKMLILRDRIFKELISSAEAIKMKFDRCIAVVDAHTQDKSKSLNDHHHRCYSRWREILEEVDEDKRRYEGDSYLFAAQRTWGVGIADNQSLIRSCEKVLRRVGIRHSDTFDYTAIYRNAEPHSGIDEWGENGMHRLCTDAIISIRYSCCPAIVILDPHSLALPCLRASHPRAGSLIIVEPPFSDNYLQLVMTSLKSDVTILLRQVTLSDLNRPWLRATVSDLANGTLKTSSEFRLLLLLSRDSQDSRLTPHVKNSTSFVSFELKQSQVWEAFTSTGLRVVHPQLDSDSQRNATKTLSRIESELSTVASGGGVPVAKKDATLPDLLRRADEAIVELQKVCSAKVNVTDISEATVAKCKVAGKSAMVALYAMFAMSDLVPTSRFSLEFYDRAISDIISTSLKESSKSSNLGETRVLPTIFNLIVRSMTSKQDSLQLGWLILLHRELLNKTPTVPLLENLHIGPSLETISNMSLLTDCVNGKTCSNFNWIFKDVGTFINTIPVHGPSILQDITSSVRTNKLYRDYYFSKNNDPSMLNSLPKFHEDCDLSTRLCLIKSIRPDLLSNAVRDFVTMETQIDFNTNNRCNVDILSEGIKQASPFTPLLVISDSDMFVATMKEIVISSNKVRSTYFVGAAQSQKSMTRSLILDAVLDGGWIVVCNLMVSSDFARDMDNTIEDIRTKQNPNIDFRLVIQTRPLSQIPVALAIKCLTIGLSPLLGLGNYLRYGVSMLSEYFKQPSSTARLTNPVKLKLLARILPCVVIFHSIVMEKQTTGWCESGQYTMEDLREVIRILCIVIRQGSINTMSYSFLRHIISRVMYGCRLHYELDKQSLDQIALSTIHEGCETESYSFCDGVDLAFVGNIEYSFLNYADKFPEDAVIVCFFFFYQTTGGEKKM